MFASSALESRVHIHVYISYINCNVMWTNKNILSCQHPDLACRIVYIDESCALVQREAQ